MLYPGNGKPLFVQLKDLILQWIDAGELQTNDKLPSERALSEDYHVSRITVRQALNDLVREGAITKRHGKGYYVAPPRKIEYRLDSLLGFIEEFAIKNMKCEITILRREFIAPPEEVRAALGLRNNAKVFLLTRLIIVEGEPLGIDYTYLPGNVARLLEGMSLYNSILYRFFEKNGFKLTTADQWISAESPTREEAELLRKKEHDPVLVIYRNTRVEGDAVLDHSRTVYRADRYRYFVTLKRYPPVSLEDEA
ncbi:MAG: GntR family transcriptional regulator [Spirochaetia bacterium]|jgi:GntR family transcriptional regulator|nr:GntR family transcriptional regulator [Spirochaetia bacterium]